MDSGQNHTRTWLDNKGVFSREYMKIQLRVYGEKYCGREVDNGC